jgi:NADH-quinone oxidoreductase subunit D
MNAPLPAFPVPATVDALPNPIRPAFEQSGDDDHVIVSIGPSHPATHGTIQIIAELDGEKIVRTDLHCGYLHRGFEKECESHTWHNLIPTSTA